MRNLTVDDLGVMLSFFVVLLLFFGVDFHVTRKRSMQRRAKTFAFISVIGEAATVVALILAWVTIFMPDVWELLDTLLVFIPGTVATLCAVVLTAESVVARFRDITNDDDETTEESA